jgi:hypothetical protein
VIAHGERIKVGPEYQSISRPRQEDKAALTKAVRDRYRCPDGFLDFRLADELSPNPGFFQFGPDTTCYGRSWRHGHGAQASTRISNLLPNVSFHKSQIVMPFDPSEIIDNLRLERYPCGQMGKYEKSLKNFYYQLRPLTSRSMRIGIQKLRASQWEKRQFPRWPVDTTVENICETLLLLSLTAQGIDRIPFIWFWPDGARGCVSMTHDVETTVGRDFSTHLMDIDDSFGIKASFQVVPEKRYPVTPDYLDSLRSRGFEVCVQDLNHDGRLFDEREEFERRVAKINRYGREYGAKGFRSAVLYRNLDWYQELEFSYDMTVPNVAHLDPQRGGCCTVMPYFIGDVLELPVTTIQDYTLFHVLNERSIDLWKMQMEKILSKNGLATFIVHPDYIVESETQAVYKELLAALDKMRKEDALWFALPGEVDSWWRSRSQMSLVKTGHSWRIVGEGSERAVLAFAKVVDGRLVYELTGTPQEELQLCNVNVDHSRAVWPPRLKSAWN